MGTVVTIWPEKIQEHQTRFQDRHPKLTALNPFADWNRSPSALLLIRCAGLIPICIALVAFYFAIRNCLR